VACVSAFTGPLTITQLDTDARLWRLETPLIYEVGALGSGDVITIQDGFITDGTSVPRILWALLPTWGTYSRAAALHDFLCTALRDGVPHPLAPTWKRAAQIFYEAMVVEGTGQVIRLTLYLGAMIWAGYRDR